jgi:hypothetical protein
LLAGFGAWYARVGGQTIKMVEAVAGRPCGQSGFTLANKMFLEADQVDAGAGIAGRYGAAGAGIAAFEMNLADGETDDAAFVFAKQLIFPEGRDAIDLERGAETPANIFEREAGKAVGSGGKPIGYGLQGSGGNNRGAAGDGIVGKAAFGIANDNLLLEENAEPFGSVLVVLREGEGAGRDFAAVGGDGEGDGGDIGKIICANEMNGGSALAIDPFAIDGIKSPGAIQGQSAGRGDARFGDRDGVEGFDGMEPDVGEMGRRRGESHWKSLAERRRESAE